MFRFRAAVELTAAYVTSGSVVVLSPNGHILVKSVPPKLALAARVLDVRVRPHSRSGSVDDGFRANAKGFAELGS